MTRNHQILVLGAAAATLGLAALAHAQTDPGNVRARDSLTLNQGGYTVLQTAPSAGEQSFADKSRIVREAYRKREIKKQKDEQALPGMTTVQTKPRSGPPS